jgi:hypothetical protein
LKFELFSFPFAKDFNSLEFVFLPSFSHLAAFLPKIETDSLRHNCRKVLVSAAPLPIFFALPLPRPHNPFAARSVLIKKTRAQNDEHYARYKDANCFSNEWRVCGGIKPLKDITIEKRNADYAKKAG